jgi:hypothetical protein
MPFKHLFIAIMVLSGHAIRAQAINWASDIAPILYENCAKCHRDGGLGHFSLIGYTNAFTNRFQIQSATAERRMPPWMPDPAYRQYAHENRLTDAEIQRITDWVEAGAPAGDLSQAPPDPVFNPDSEVGEPDHVLMTPFFTITATDDEYRCFVLPNGLNQTAFLRGLEAIPGNHEVVHHILIYEDTTGQGQALDAQTPNEPGYVNFGGPGVSGARLVGGWVPGSRTFLTPPNMGIKLTPGADLIVQMHYPKGVTGMSDQTRLNFFFTPDNQGIREIRLAPLLNHSPLSLENGPLNIPPNEIKTYHAQFTVPQTGSILSVAPHMHLIGRRIESFAVTLQGDTIPLIRINDWNFHWQGSYAFQYVQKIPFGAKLHAYATYDNTENNPFQPSLPPQTVVQGEATTDEMLIVYFAFMAYEPGDENILLDSTLLSSGTSLPPADGPVARRLDVFPNPADSQVEIQVELPEKCNYRLAVVRSNGQIIQLYAEKEAVGAGLVREHLDVSALPPGTYFVELKTSLATVYTGRLVKK